MCIRDRSNIEGEKPEAGEVGQANNQNQTQNGNNQMPGGNNSEPPSITNNKDSNNANGNDTQKPAPPSMENTQGGRGDVYKRQVSNTCWFIYVYNVNLIYIANDSSTSYNRCIIKFN